MKRIASLVTITTMITSAGLFLNCGMLYIISTTDEERADVDCSLVDYSTLQGETYDLTPSCKADAQSWSDYHWAEAMNAGLL